MKKNYAIIPNFSRNTHIIWSVVAVAALIYLLWAGISDFDYRWRWRRAFKYVIDYKQGSWVIGPLLNGLITTIKISFYAILLALLIGVITVIARLSPLLSLRWLSTTYVNFIRVTPLLVQLYLFYFMLNNVIQIGRFESGVITLAVFEGAFIAEIIRSSVINVPQSQLDAANAVGLNRWQRWRLVLLPQALPLMLPALANVLVNLIKHSSIVTIIAVADLTDAARNLISQTFLALEIWLIVGGLYIAICLPLAWGIKRWEDKVRKGNSP